jgi:hypothetical protein
MIWKDLGAIDPAGRAKANRVAEGKKEDEEDVGVVC